MKKEKGHFFLIQAENMQQGNYVLRLSGEKETRIDIQVHRGKFWNGLDNVIVKNNCIREITSSQKIVKIKDSQVQLTNAEAAVRVQLVDYSPNTRVHIFA